MLNISFAEFPNLSTDRLLLRQIDPQDADAIFALRTNEEVMRYIHRPRPASLVDVLELIQQIHNNFTSNQGISWGICAREGEAYIGTIGLWRIDKPNHRAEIGYLLNPLSQGKGLMHEAIRAVTQYGFRELNLHSIEANVHPLNTASRRLLEKSGFVQEAHFRENYFFEGSFLDSIVYSLLNPGHG
jgi:[ribosomal protein S5]-alanine N-acetyltransferase